MSLQADLTEHLSAPGRRRLGPRFAISRRTRWFLQRLMFIPVAAVLVATAAYFLTNTIPSDPARAILGSTATEATLHRENVLLGLNHGLFYRYVEYMKQLFLHGSLGHSYYGGRSVWADIGEYLPSSIELALLGLVVALVLGVTVGAIGAYFFKGPVDRVLKVPIVGVLTTPDFLIGLVFIYFLFYKFGWFPPPTGQLNLTGAVDNGPLHAALVDAIIHGNGPQVWAALRHAVLPALTLGISASAFFMLITRSTVARALGSFQVEFARASGLPARKVFLYAFLDARTQIITYVGILLAGLIGSDVIVEQIFSWNGLGQFFIQRANQVDLPEIEGIALVLSMITVGVFLLVDLIVGLLDPRISYA